MFIATILFSYVLKEEMVHHSTRKLEVSYERPAKNDDIRLPKKKKQDTKTQTDRQTNIQ